MRRNSAVIFSLLAFFFMAARCAAGSPLPEDYYAGTGKIAGANPPSVPVVTFSQAQLRFDFTASVDPDTGSEVGTYYIYFYDGVPQIHYEPRYIDRAISPPAAKSFSVAAISGVHTVIVTGFDGGRESAVTSQNKITFTIP